MVESFEDFQEQRQMKELESQSQQTEQNQQQLILPAGQIQMQEQPAYLPSAERLRPGMMLEENDQPMTVQGFMNQPERFEDRDKRDGSDDDLLQ